MHLLSSMTAHLGSASTASILAQRACSLGLTLTLGLSLTLTRGAAAPLRAAILTGYPERGCCTLAHGHDVAVAVNAQAAAADAGGASASGPPRVSSTDEVARMDAARAPAAEATGSTAVAVGAAALAASTAAAAEAARVAEPAKGLLPLVAVALRVEGVVAGERREDTATLRVGSLDSTCRVRAKLTSPWISLKDTRSPCRRAAPTARTFGASAPKPRGPHLGREGWRQRGRYCR